MSVRASARGSAVARRLRSYLEGPSAAIRKNDPDPNRHTH